MNDCMNRSYHELLSKRKYTERKKKRILTWVVICIKDVLTVYMNFCLKCLIFISALIVFAKRPCVCRMLMVKTIGVAKGKSKRY